jgi:hypothetical protein
VVANQKYYRADNRDHQTVEIQTRNSCRSKNIKEKTTNEGADNTEQDVSYYPFAGSVDELAANEARHQTQQ